LTIVDFCKHPPKAISRWRWLRILPRLASILFVGGVGAFDFIQNTYDDNALVDKMPAAIAQDTRHCARKSSISCWNRNRRSLQALGLLADMAAS